MSKKVTVELTGPARILVGRKEGRHTINDLDGKAMLKEGDQLALLSETC